MVGLLTERTPQKIHCWHCGTIRRFDGSLTDGGFCTDCEGWVCENCRKKVEIAKTAKDSACPVWLKQMTARESRAEAWRSYGAHT